MLKRLSLLLALVALGARLDAADRILRTELVLDAPIADVWKAWTTEAGLISFFAPNCRIEPKVDGAFEILFNPAAEPGLRGSEGMRILAFEPLRRLAFTWNAPPDQPYARAQRTVVNLDFQEVDARHTRLRFTHLGFGDGPEWDQAYTYFDHAWNGYVLPNLRYRLANGAIDWKNPPRLSPLAASLQMTLVETASVK